MGELLKKQFKEIISLLKKIFFAIPRVILWILRTPLDMICLLGVIGDTIGMFFLWMIFTIVGGLMGPIITVINALSHNSKCWVDSLQSAIAVNANAGTFFTFSVALIASSIGSILLTSWKEKTEFNKLRLLFVAIAIFPMLFSAVCYSWVIKTSMTINQNVQCVLLIAAIILSIYSYCIQYIAMFKEKYDRYTDTYVSNENSRISLTATSRCAGSMFGKIKL